MNKAFLFLLLLTLTKITDAQSPEIDRLKKEINDHPKNDTFRVNRLNELADNSSLNSEERRKIVDEAIAISKNINYPIGLGYGLIHLGMYKINEGKPQKGKQFLLQADSIANKTGNIELKANVLWRMTATTSDSHEREALLFDADSIAKKTSNLGLQARILSALGNTLASNGNRNGIHYLLLSEKTAQESGDKTVLASCQFMIGQQYQIVASNYAKGMEYYLKALHSAEEANDPRLLITSWIGIANIYSVMGDQDNALSYLLKADSANKKLGNVDIESNLQNTIGERYRLLGKYPEAIKAYNKSIELTTDKASVMSYIL